VLLRRIAVTHFRAVDLDKHLENTTAKVKVFGAIEELPVRLSVWSCEFGKGRKQSFAARNTEHEGEAAFLRRGPRADDEAAAANGQRERAIRRYAVVHADFNVREGVYAV
jgi:hypothetical protein